MGKDMSTIAFNPAITGAVRPAGKTLLHTVSYKGQVVGARYATGRVHPYAICHWDWDPTISDRRVFVDRWSSSPTCRSHQFSVEIRPVE